MAGPIIAGKNRRDLGGPFYFDDALHTATDRGNAGLKCRDKEIGAETAFVSKPQEAKGKGNCTDKHDNLVTLTEPDAERGKTRGFPFVIPL